MKSTGLFGKHSGRVGGVVYSNYRGLQIVRSYQPQVRNPKSAQQVEQRARFKLVSQVSASLSREINLSFIPQSATQTNRNAFMSAMLKKTIWDSMNEKAMLPIEEIVLTNSRESVITSVSATPEGVTGTYNPSFSQQIPFVHLVQIGWAEGDEIQILGSWDFRASDDGTFDSSSNNVSLVESRLASQRVIMYLYVPSDESLRFEDYIVSAVSDSASLSTIKSLLSGNLRYSATVNYFKPINV